MRIIYIILGVAAVFLLIAAVFAGLLGNDEEGDNNNGNNEDRSMSISSPAFSNNNSIPSRFTCDATTSTNPRLIFSDIPENTRSLALLMDDPDVPTSVRPEGVFDHWVLFNISPTTTEIGEGATAGTQGNNGRGTVGYIGPCPPPQFEPSEHRYFFTLYALDNVLNLNRGATKNQVLNAMQGHVIEKAELVGRYKRVTTSTP